MVPESTPSRAREFDALADAVVQLSFEVTAIASAVANDHGLSLTQLRLLGILRDHAPRITELAAHLGLDRSSVSGLVDRAAARELVRRLPDTDDARATRVAITEPGRELMASLARDLAVPLGTLLAPLEARERSRLVSTLRRVLSALPR